MASTKCAPVEPTGTSFESFARELDELARLIVDGRDLDTIRIERLIALGQLEDDSGQHDLAAATWDDAMTQLDGRLDLDPREVRRMTILVWCRRGTSQGRQQVPGEAVDCYGRAFELARAAFAQWRDAELAELLVDVALAHGFRNAELGHHETAIRSYDGALAVCALFRDDPKFLRFEAKLECERVDVMVVLKRPEADTLEWFDRALESYAALADQEDWQSLAALWLSRGNAATDSMVKRHDYGRVIAVAEPLLPDLDAAAVIAKACHNTARLLDTPADALPFQTRAVEMMYDVLDREDTVENQFDVLYYRLVRSTMLARSGLLAAAIDEVREVLPVFERVVESYQQDRGASLARSYHEKLKQWTRELASRTPVAYRTRTIPPEIRSDEPRCTFCGRPRSQVAVMIAGLGAHTCSDCVFAAAAVIAAIPEQSKPRHVQCAFCLELHDRVGMVNNVAICEGCVASCSDMHQEARLAGNASVPCAFCKRRRADVAKLIGGKAPMAICNHCVVAAAAFFAANPAASHAVTKTAECRFCAEHRQRIVAAADGVICDDCVELCAGILAEAIEESHPDLACGFCNAPRTEVGRLVLGPETALCDGCFAHARRLLDRHHPYDPALGRRRGTRETQLDVCDWCTTREALMFAHGEHLVLCDACVDLAVLDFG